MAQKKLPKAPRKPRASASTQVLENYLHKHAEWKKKINAVHAERKRKETLKKRIASLK